MAVFSGNVNLLVAAPMLQDYLVDKDGTPMANGTITCYHDNSRTTLKNWYYQTGTPGNYTYIALPNPLTLSAAGTICDINGVDTIPFFYPCSEVNDTVRDPYYITIVNYAQTNQITRENFPFLPLGGSNPNLINSYTNLIINNGFWRNIAPNTTSGTPTSITLNNILTGPVNGLYSAKVAPSQHDGFRYHDIVFFKNNTSATDTLTFTAFPLATTQPISNHNVPEYYINHVSNATGSSGETTKYYQFPIALHVNSLANVPFTVSIQAQNAGGTGTGQNVISLYILQDTGTGTSSATPQLISNVSISLNSSWQTYTLTDIFPATSGLTLGEGADDALYLLIGLPLNTAFTINFTKPSIYLTQNTIPNYDYQTYDAVNSVISSPRTGDIRITTNPFYVTANQWIYGWVPMNDGVIGLSVNGVTSTATIPGYTRGNTDTWPLYNLLWALAQPFDTGSNFNAICQIYTNSASTLTATNYGASAYADFTANKALQLTRMFGRALMGTVPMNALFSGYAPQSQGVTASNSAGNLLLTTASTPALWQGAPIYFRFSSGGSLPGNIVSTAIYYVTNISGSTFNVATTYANAIAGTPVVAWSSAGSNVFIDYNYTGSAIGEYTHTQTLNELVGHTHNLTGQTGTAFTLLTSAGGTSLLTTSGGASVTQSTGGSLPFNIVQPVTFYNVLIKL